MMTDEVYTGLRAALLGFDEEVGRYCQGISDAAAQQFAIDYARMLQARVRGVNEELPRGHTRLFEPHRNLIKSTLERILQKHFPDRAPAR
jgi:hypothetical protein